MSPKIRLSLLVAAVLCASIVACASPRGGLHGASFALDGARLASVMASQPSDVQLRYPQRHPRETLEFFGLAPGMTVVEVLPGGSWYSKLLVPYLGKEGTLVGANYALEMAALFSFMTPERLEKRKTWASEWPQQAAGFGDASVRAFVLGGMPDDLAGRADAVVMIRALHNLKRFEAKGGFLTTALAEVYRALKPGGILGVVQHRASEDASDAWADGSAGYLKQSFVIARLEAAGFEFVAESGVNANPLDRPTVDDVVWRLPPVLMTSRDDPALRAKLQAVGESNRMTLKFRKPLR